MRTEPTPTEALILEMKDLKATIKQLEAKLSKCSEALDEHRANGLLDPYEGEDGSFYIYGCRLIPCTRSTWAYSKAVKQLQEQEKVSGAATQKQSSYLRFELPKPEEDALF